MKKILVALLVGTLLLTFVGCAETPKTDLNSSDNSSGVLDVIPSKPQDSSSSATSNTDSSQSSTVQSGLITEEKAKEIALENAGVNAAGVSRLKIELDRDDGVVSYEIEFFVGKDEYDYDIHAETGKILKAEKNDVSILPVESGNLIGEDKAKQIALEKAGLKAENVTRLKAEYDIDDGVKSYEVEFVSGGFEYDYDIDATSGKILKESKEKDD